jgi:hypothetical protein
LGNSHREHAAGYAQCAHETGGERTVGLTINKFSAPEEMHKNREDILGLLNKHFKTAVLERYPEAMMMTFVENAWNVVLGKDYKKERVSKAARERIRDNILQQLRTYYGKWITVVNFDKKFRFRTNFEYVYKTEHGRLYGNPPNTAFSNLFFTSHSLEQFEERVPLEKYKDFSTAYKRVHGTAPTAADIIPFFVMCCFQYAVHKNFIYLNVNYGILVLEVLSQHVCIAKTFLSPDMNIPLMSWRIIRPEFKLFIDNVDPEILVDKMKEISDPLDEPSFELPGFDYAFFYAVLGKRRYC